MQLLLCSQFEQIGNLNFNLGRLAGLDQLHLYFFLDLWWSIVLWISAYICICETQPPASIGSIFTCLFVVCRLSVPHCNISSYLHYMMFQTIQTIYFLWGCDPGNMSVSFIAALSPVYCCLVIIGFEANLCGGHACLRTVMQRHRMWIFSICILSPAVDKHKYFK